MEIIAFIIFFGFLALLRAALKDPFVGSSDGSESLKYSRHTVQSNYDRLHRRVWDSYLEGSTAKMKKDLSNLEANYEAAKPYLSSGLMPLYDKDIREMKKDLVSELIGDWEDTVDDDFLSDFQDIYLELSDESCRLSYSEARSAKNELLRLWRKYYVSAKNYEVHVDADSHLRSYMGSDFSSYMLSESALDAKSTEWVNAIHLKEDATNILSEFKKSYQFIVLKSNSFSNVDEAFKSKTHCLSLRKKYFELNQKYNLNIDLNEFFTKYMGCDFVTCMLSNDELESHLNDLLSPLRSMQERKKRLTQEILSTLDSSAPIRRSALLKQPYKNGSEKEVTCCYHDLLKKNSIIEEQLNRYYYVSLTEKGQKQLKKPRSPKLDKTIA